MDQFHNDSVSLDYHILYLKDMACRYPCGHLQRQLYMTQLIRCIERSGRLWKDSSPYYEDALQMTWAYCCQNLCEACTSAAAHDPSRASVITWLNAYLKWRLHDLAVDQRRAASRFELSTLSDSASVWDASTQRPDIPPILDEIRQWVVSDPSGALSCLHLRDHPHITAQYLILRRLPPETSWQVLSHELNVSISTLSSFYRRHCLPNLREFGKSEGYF